LGSLLVLAVSCGDDPDNDDDGGSGQGLSGSTGQGCSVPDDCFGDVALRDDIQGEFTCLDRVEGGYCTHECVTDDDCCAVEGECPDGVNHVCGPFESTGLMLCFISCENEDLGGEDSDAYCDGFHADFICRSTGGGSDNKKVCVPGGGNACNDENDCAADFPHCCEDDLGVDRCYDQLSADGRTCTNPP